MRSGNASGRKDGAVDINIDHGFFPTTFLFSYWAFLGYFSLMSAEQVGSLDKSLPNRYNTVLVS
jgi:hypothetical protein